MSSPSEYFFSSRAPIGIVPRLSCPCMWMRFDIDRLFFRLTTIFLAALPMLSNAAGPSPETGSATNSRSFWAFQPVKRSAPPPVTNRNWPRNAVDFFVLARLESQGLRPAPPATKADLIRRVYFDLTGLPPAPEEVQAFVEDGSPLAYERLVDRLLNSPHYGERWGQHWLDVVRYAETEGFEYDRHVPDAWRYRDYVIKSLNQDKPFDRFILEQVAGDELDTENLDLLTASVFYRLGPVRRNAGNPEVALSRNEILTDRTDIIGSSFLGLTVGCARCHDHKFDPISQQDYYRLQAFLAATEEHDVLLASDAEKTAWKAKTGEINAKLRQLRRQLTRTEDPQRRQQLDTEIETLEDQMPQPPATIPSTHNDDLKRTAIHVLKRGDWERKGPQVGPRVLGALAPESIPELSPETPQPRTRLAQWLANAENPLTTRVLANRLWNYHFGQGIVKTANDFGKNGDRPSHPELLDWLASELIGEGWRLKPMHRLILLSNTYQQSSTSPEAETASVKDPDNRLLWRFSRRRLSAEEIRDAMLSVSGRLNLREGGRSVMVPVDRELVNLLYKPSQWEVTKDRQEHYRRSIYLIAKRNLRLPFMEVFDQPALQTSCARREASTHAPQALELLNGKLSNELADAFAQRLTAEVGFDKARQIDRAYWLAAGRAPTSKEIELALRFCADQPLREFALSLFNLNSFLYVR